MEQKIKKEIEKQKSIMTGYAIGYANTDDPEQKAKFERHKHCIEVLKQLLK